MSSGFAAAPEAHSGSGLVVTDGILQNAALLAPWMRQGLPFLLVGPEGCCKAMLIEHCIAEMPVSVPFRDPCCVAAGQCCSNCNACDVQHLPRCLP